MKAGSGELSMLGKNTLDVRGLVVIIFLMIFAPACSVVDLLIDATPSDVSPILYRDDFSDESSGWERSAQGGRKDYYQGTYHINVLDPNLFSWSNARQSMGDVIVSVDVAFTGPAELAEMGVICRMQNSSDFYFFTIRSDGGYGIFKMYQGNDHFLGMQGYRFDQAIKTGLSTNHMEAHCVGDQLSLYVNDALLATVQDSSYQLGDLGLIVGTFEQSDANAFFDNFVISRPDQ
jgi:hypothetical protein